MTDPEIDAVAAQNERGRGELRAVLDTNVPIAAHLSRNPHSPTIELLARWRGGQFTQLYSDDMLVELVEKFQARKIAAGAGTEPRAVAQVIYHAATDAGWRLRYPVGMDAWQVSILRWLLPERAFYWVLEKAVLD